MAGGALTHSHANLAMAVTGIAGPDGGTPEKPVGLVYFAAGRRDGPVRSERVEFGDPGRNVVQRQSVAHALRMLRSLL
jgi:nicotinamide-nucleotide amidase